MTIIKHIRKIIVVINFPSKTVPKADIENGKILFEKFNIISKTGFIRLSQFHWEFVRISSQ